MVIFHKFDSLLLISHVNYRTIGHFGAEYMCNDVYMLSFFLNLLNVWDGYWLEE
jgi:hypothetical protein